MSANPRADAMPPSSLACLGDRLPQTMIHLNALVQQGVLSQPQLIAIEAVLARDLQVPKDKAATRVFVTTELLEAILLELPQHCHTFTLKRVNKAFKETIETSPELKKRFRFTSDGTATTEKQVLSPNPLLPSELHLEIKILPGQSLADHSASRSWNEVQLHIPAAFQASSATKSQTLRRMPLSNPSFKNPRWINVVHASGCRHYKPRPVGSATARHALLTSYPNPCTQYTSYTTQIFQHVTVLGGNGHVVISHSGSTRADRGRAATAETGPRAPLDNDCSPGTVLTLGNIFDYVSHTWAAGCACTLSMSSLTIPSESLCGCRCEVAF